MTKQERILKIELKIEKLMAEREKLTGEANRGPFVPLPDETGKCPAGWYNADGKCVLDS